MRNEWTFLHIHNRVPFEAITFAQVNDDMTEIGLNELDEIDGLDQQHEGKKTKRGLKCEH